ncbi:hypothetical protein L3Q72_21920 [Vibrio sp. JC009]|uniref:hypothetical protein n=1 Tax=Vibrio sp. JC009 TaxID=2912314 RepID=UPI0023AED8DD|nr:hypothetical protein [Vibrio sp. JC009]WED23893.1 hypothetical protein L3Q72_21920 [Vibrio sp. JC009]
MTEQEQIKRLREDLQACANYLHKPVTLPSMVKVRCERNLRNLHSMLETADANNESLSAGYIRKILAELEKGDVAEPEKQRAVIENTIGLLRERPNRAA